MNAPIEQGTPEWHAARAGKFTGSKFIDAIARNKKTGEKLKSWDDLVWEVAVERLTGVQDEGFDSYATRWGTEVEPFAREAYELATGHFVEQVAFVDHPLHPFVGVSPDGLIGDDGGLEMKAPKNSQIHLQRFDTGMPDEFIPQVQGCMWVTGRKWWDFVSYDPRMPEKLRMLRLTIKRDDAYIARLEASVLEAEIAVAAIVEKFNRRMSA